MADVARFRSEIQTQNRPRELALAELASRQHGVVAHRQLRELGYGRGAIKHRVALGRLHPIRHGVYAVGHLVLTWGGRTMAAVLACGPEAVASHWAAAALWGLLPSSRSLVDVTVPRGIGCKRPGITLHATRRLHPADVTVIDGIPVTSLARILLDLAEVASQRQLERAIEQAERLGLFDLRAVVELDSHAFHSTRVAFERDRLRDAKLQLARYRVVRVTHRRLEREPAAVAETVRALLSCSSEP